MTKSLLEPLYIDHLSIWASPKVFYFTSIFILLTGKEATEALIHRVGNYLTCFRRSQDIAVHLKFNRDMTNLELLVKTTKQGKVPLSVFPKDTTEWRE